ncbi:MAG: hypothetical protein FJY85_23170, partial [Deltaproteobacteria bacterium]|nr:hypothetical protein [Deltaproteobacteria bacterium]
MPRLILRDDYVDEIVRTTQGQKTVRRYFEDSEDSILSTKSDMEHGHHGMRRMLSPIHQVIRLLNRLNMVNEEQYRILRGMYGALSIIMGFYLVYWTINNLVKQYENYQRMLAAGETAFYWLTPGGRIRIANAL